ncbi:hypothetical protein BDM02DRAFT_2796109 [Thelephora ganbajun]|uniref:Uncharacterized protein n=1 Tax=Thelephora ganbajun TaxID=370292 RepID=A0ACB6ZSN1_THEGA|nr:hypothetical protein BDM02DRAFT_2796109 [Thelephora ganbajun]
MSQGGHHGRIHAYRTAKRAVLGAQAQGPSPAWKGGDRNGSDVTLQEVSDLFNKTVGPTKEVILFYNDKGSPKGMALVGFQRNGDAALAADKYDGRFVDNKRPLRVEIIVGKDAAAPSKRASATKESSSSSPQPMSLLERMNITPVKGPTPPKIPKQLIQRVPAAPAEVVTKPKAVPTKRKRTRKGPARLTKKKPTAQDLDEEMDAYRAAVPQIG